jgi:hypothetical protein
MEEAGYESTPVAALEPVIGHHGPLAEDARPERGQPTGRAAHMMGMHDVGAGQRPKEPRRQRVRGMSVAVGQRSQCPKTKAARIADIDLSPAEAEHLAVDVFGQRPP